MVVVMRLGVEPAALAALHDHAVRIMVRHVDQQLRLARSAAIGLVAATFAGGRPGSVFHHIGAFGLGRGQQDHVELGHCRKPRLFNCRDGQSPGLSTASFLLPAFAAAVYRSAR